MVGPVLDYEAKRILNKGIAQGLSQGIAQGRSQIIEQALRKGKSLKEISEFFDIPLEDVVSYQKGELYTG